MSCSFCNTPLNNYLQSAEIPGSSKMYYVFCKGCGNVMKAKIENNIIVDLEGTSTKKGLKTRREIMLALKLFEEAGERIVGYSVGNSSTPDVDIDTDKSLINKIKDFYKTVF